MGSAFIAAPTAFGKKSTRLRFCRAHRQAVRYTPLATTARPSAHTKQGTDPVPTQTLPEEQHALSPAFSWTDQWYAVALTVDVPAGKPFAFTLFDSPLVLFRSSLNEFTVLEDRCSHRLAPLSEGRVVQKGNCAEIECPYHGWQFNGTGACTRIPQNDAGASPPRSAAVRSYPTAEALGAVWVWTGEPANADPRAIPVVALGLTEKVTVLSMTRLSSMKFETMMENLVDLNHVFFAHHGVTDWKRTDSRIGVGGEVQRAPDGAPPGSFEVDWAHMRSHFRAPATLALAGEAASGFDAAVTLFACSPAGHRSSRMIVWLLTDPSNLQVRTVFAIHPRWVAHADGNLITDGDIVLLRSVERELGDERKWSDKYGPPAGKGDQPVYALRKFMDQHRDSMPWRQPPPVIEAEENLNRAQIIDRLHTHTMHCSACSGALRGWRLVKAASYAGAVSAFAVLLGLAALAATSQPGAINLEAVRKLVAADVVLLGALFTAWKMSCEFEEDLTYTDKSRRLYES